MRTCTKTSANTQAKLAALQARAHALLTGGEVQQAADVLEHLVAHTQRLGCMLLGSVNCYCETNKGDLWRGSSYFLHLIFTSACVRVCVCVDVCVCACRAPGRVFDMVFMGPGVLPHVRALARPAPFASRSLLRALLTPQVNSGSLYRRGRST